MCYKDYQPVGPYCGPCGRCPLYRETCSPVIVDGYVCGGECDYDYCPYCAYYEDCPKYYGRGGEP